MQTIAETLLEQGKAAGIKEGKAAGIEEGLAEGEAKSLTRLLERRFGPLPSDVHERIAGAGIDQVEQWFDTAIDAPDLASVFETKARH